MGFLRRHAHLLLVTCLLGGALLLRADGITAPSVESRELHNALVARQLYLGDGTGLPVWQQDVLRELGDVAQPIEPPILDLLAASAFRIAGGEHLWIPRLASAMLWVGGGIFLLLIALRITTREGALVALALYLFWPYAVWLSRLYMPDGMMVALLLAAALAVIRYWELPSWGRLFAAGAVSSVATAAKPGVALIFLVSLFTVIAISRRAFRETVGRGRLPLFIVLASTLAAVYYVYGVYVHDFLAGESGGRVQPRLIVTESFWSGWWEMVSSVLAYPQRESYLALAPLALAFGGIAVARRGMSRAVLAGLALGYLLFALVVPGFTATHAYYALPLIPILALAIGTLAGFVFVRLRMSAPGARLVVMVFAALAIGVAAFKSHAVLSGEPPHRDIAAYRRIGEITGHTAHAIVVDVRLRSPVSYWGWIVGRYWYPPTPSQDLPSSGDLFPTWIDPATAEFLVVVAVSELETEHRLRDFTRELPLVSRTDRFAIFDLRDGRAVAAERRSHAGGSG